MRDIRDDTDGGPTDPPEPRPDRPSGGAPPAPAQRPQPAPRSPSTPPSDPPFDEPIDRGPVVKPRPGGRDTDPPLPTELSGPIGARWKALGGLAWGRPTSEPEPVGSGKGVTFMLNGLHRFATILWRSSTGAVLVDERMMPTFSRTGGAKGALGLPTADERPTHDGVGRYQTFDGGVIVWHPNLGASAVFGAINAAYAAAGGSGYGYPLSDQALAPDGRAWVQEFREMSGGGDRSIYWTAAHGAHTLYGAIREAWRSYRGEASLGYPTTDEMSAANGVRWQRFEGADYIWHPDTGAHEVHGDIGAAYHALGGSQWGFPTTDQTPTPDGVGRFNHFRGPGGDDRSIYWTPNTGAQPVFGLIRNWWAANGWERSHLGYPTGPEVPWVDGGPGAIQQSFQGGRMLYRADLNLTGPDPIQHFHDFGTSSQLQGWVKVRLFSDGRVEYTGHQRATGENSYSFGIQVGVTDGTTGIANAWEGEVAGTFQSGSRNADWSESVVSPVAQTDFWNLQLGHLEVRRLKDKSLGWVSGVLESGLKFLIGSGAGFVIGPAGGMLAVVGTLAGSVVSGGNFQGGLRAVAGTLWMAGPGGMLVALAAEGVYQLMTDERPLNDEEWRIAQLVFSSQLPARDDIRITNAVGGNNRPFVYKRFDGITTINMGEWYDDPCGMYEDFWRDKDDHSKGTFRRGEKLVHELTHVWQLEHGSNFVLVAKGMAKVFGEEYEYTAGTAFREYNLEQQATIVQDWFGRHYTRLNAADEYGLASAAATDPTGDDLWHYIRDEIRSGTGSAL